MPKENNKSMINSTIGVRQKKKKNSTIGKITHGAGTTLASTDASLLSALIPNSFA
jgi:hypothetical protein